MGIYDVYQTDRTKERDQGAELEFPEGVRIWIKRAGGANTQFDRVMDQVMRPYRRQIQQNLLDEGKSQELEAIVYARAVIIDWEGVTDEYGKELECTEENIVKVLTDLPDLFTDIRVQANAMANFRDDAQQIDAENLPSSPVAKPPGRAKRQTSGESSKNAPNEESA